MPHVGASRALREIPLEVSRGPIGETHVFVHDEGQGEEQGEVHGDGQGEGQKEGQRRDNMRDRAIRYARSAPNPDTDDKVGGNRQQPKSTPCHTFLILFARTWMQKITHRSRPVEQPQLHPHLRVHQKHQRERADRGAASLNATLEAAQ